MNAPAAHSPSAWIAVDGGSTNTRVWLLHEGRVIARASAGVGARVTAQDGSPDKLRAALRELIAQVCAEDRGVQPSLVAAAGMITSALGLLEVAHVPAPASEQDLARGARQASVAEVTSLPFFLFPGVRCGDLAAADVSQTDVMRGEETLCVGLLADERFKPPFSLLNLGSHWKLNEVDGAGRIARSRTSLSGELIHATQTSTILASGLPAGKLERLDSAWCEHGMTELRRSGLARALFCVRLLEMHDRGTPGQRMSFLIGAYVAAELDALWVADRPAMAGSVILAGSGAIARAWEAALTHKQLKAHKLTEPEAEAAFVAGIGRLVQIVA